MLSQANAEFRKFFKNCGNRRAGARIGRKVDFALGADDNGGQLLWAAFQAQYEGRPLSAQELDSAVVSELRRVSDSQLGEAVRQELPEELLPLLGELRPRLKAIAETELSDYLRARLDASDLVQETLLRGFKQIAQFKGATDTEFAAWLREILRHQIIDAARHHARKSRDSRREQPLPEAIRCANAEPASAAARRAESAVRVRRAIEELPEQYRAVILLRQEEDLTFEEIGQRMRRSADAVRMLWGRAILQMGKLMQQDG